MTTYSATDFGHTVLNDFTSRRQGLEVKEMAMTKSADLQSRSLGHPKFEDLALGERRAAPMACVFLDLTNFTGRTFWDDATEVVDLAHAVLTGFVEVVSIWGGFALGLRGDGLFAGFGPGDRRMDSIAALGACAFALDAVEREVNPRLKARGLRPVQVRAGVDYGRITFVRSGSHERSEINPLGFAANFAAKCEKKADSWQIVVGEGLAEAAHNNDVLVEHPDSPKEYNRDYERRYYKFYDYRWRRSLPHLAGAMSQINGTPTPKIHFAQD